MASVRAGVVSGVEVNGPINNGTQTGPLWDPQSSGTWAGIWFVVAIILLFVVL